MSNYLPQTVEQAMTAIEAAGYRVGQTDRVYDPIKKGYAVIEGGYSEADGPEFCAVKSGSGKTSGKFHSELRAIVDADRKSRVGF